ncbi:hypothetical protein LCGC14_1927070, partial [marine sediment metagenome]
MKNKEQATKKDCAYAAGFFDGEGCVHPRITQCAKPSRYCPNVILSIGQQNPKVLHILRDRINVGYVRTRVVKKQNKPFCMMSYWWITKHEDIIKFIACILPYTIVKHEELMLAMRFCGLHYRR